MTGSFCTFSKAFTAMEALRDLGCDILPIMSLSAGTTDTRFGTAQEHIKRAEKICGKRVIMSVCDAEPIGPKKLLDILIIEPCTGNTLAKLANGITDTPVTLAAKAHLRNERPVLIGLATNDALSAAASNIGRLMNVRNIYFVPMKQDDPSGKPRSVICDFDLTERSMQAALNGVQLQPLLL
mgnify:CR=1 FL=1